MKLQVDSTYLCTTFSVYITMIILSVYITMIIVLVPDYCTSSSFFQHASLICDNYELKNWSYAECLQHFLY